MTDKYDGQEPAHHASARGSAIPDDPREKIIKQIEQFCEECGEKHHPQVNCEDVSNNSKDESGDGA